ncbi:MAG TPA: SH3 domain-containing protein [Spirochaetota bacterium]|nr:SH3 domain-containing protein [Spirochaetota bacterium]HPJ34431.1 SH3 domain-containing protein [Spirochaetota bacterium]
MKLRIFFLLILVSATSLIFSMGRTPGNSETLEKLLCSDFTGSTINASSVNVREKPDTGSAVITRLNKNDRITVIECTGEALFVDKYLGVWLKVKTATGKEGYILSSFVNSPANRIDQFHIFFSDYREAWIKKRINKITEHTEFPLAFVQSFEGEEETSEIEKKDFFSKVSIREPYMYKMTFEKGEDNVVLAHYGYEAQQYTLFFTISGGKWKLFKIKISSC